MRRLTRRTASTQGADLGATAVEYGLLIALIAGVIVGIMSTVGQQVLDMFTSLVPRF